MPEIKKIKTIKPDYLTDKIEEDLKKLERGELDPKKRIHGGRFAEVVLVPSSVLEPLISDMISIIDGNADETELNLDMVKDCLNKHMLRLHEVYKFQGIEY